MPPGASMTCTADPVNRRLARRHRRGPSRPLVARFFFSCRPAPASAAVGIGVLARHAPLGIDGESHAPPIDPSSPPPRAAMATPGADSAAALAAAERAFRRFAMESWTLYGLGCSSTLLRTYARVRAVGVAHLRPDDYLAWLGTVRAAAPLVCACVRRAGRVADARAGLLHGAVGARLLHRHGRARPRQQRHDRRPARRPVARRRRVPPPVRRRRPPPRAPRAVLSAASVAGSKIQVAGWTVYSALIWSFKASMLFFFVRLTVRPARRLAPRPRGSLTRCRRASASRTRCAS